MEDDLRRHSNRNLTQFPAPLYAHSFSALSLAPWSLHGTPLGQGDVLGSVSAAAGSCSTELLHLADYHYGGNHFDSVCLFAPWS